MKPPKDPKTLTLASAQKATRDLQITLERDSGSITYFYAFLNDIRVLQSPGTKKATWKGKIPGSQIRIKVRVVGIDQASFKFGIDLPGVADDQSLTLSLQGGYYETEITL